MANIEFKTLEQFMPYWCQKILPAVYDDSLSYYQLLGRILQKYNEVIEIVNKHSETLVDHENRITAAEAQIELNRQAIEALKEELAKLDEQVKQNTANIAKLTERVNGHDEAIEGINTWINNASTFLLVNHRATINPSTHDMKLQVFDTMFPQWVDWYEVIANGGDSWVIMSGTTASDKAIGVLSMTPGQVGQFTAFGAMVEDNDLHYFTATYSRQGSAANLGGTDDWKEVELLDITNIKQSLGDGEYDTISQKVLTQLINSKLNHDMGITGATAGQYINVATVDADGKPLTYGVGTPGGGGSGVDIVQTTGQSTTSVMSQKAVTDALNAITPTPGGAEPIVVLNGSSGVYSLVDAIFPTKTKEGIIATLDSIAFPMVQSGTAIMPLTYRKRSDTSADLSWVYGAINIEEKSRNLFFLAGVRLFSDENNLLATNYASRGFTGENGVAVPAQAIATLRVNNTLAAGTYNSDSGLTISARVNVKTSDLADAWTNQDDIYVDLIFGATSAVQSYHFPVRAFVNDAPNSSTKQLCLSGCETVYFGNRFTITISCAMTISDLVYDSATYLTDTMEVRVVRLT